MLTVQYFSHIDHSNVFLLYILMYSFYIFNVCMCVFITTFFLIFIKETTSNSDVFTFWKYSRHVYSPKDVENVKTRKRSRTWEPIEIYSPLVLGSGAWTKYSGNKFVSVNLLVIIMILFFIKKNIYNLRLQYSGH